MSCHEVCRLLGPHHDDELGIDEQIAVESHLSRCPECFARREALTSIQTLLRHAAGRCEREGSDPVEASEALGEDVLDRALRAVVEQVVRERRLGWHGYVDRLMLDGTAWWIPSGALVVTLVAAAALAAVLTLFTPTHSHSLASVLLALGSPGSNANPVMVARGVTPPQILLDRGLPPVLSVPPAVPRNVTLAAVVTREGEVSWVEVMRSNELTDELRHSLSLLTSVTRFKPALYGGLPVAVNVVWVLEQTTVRPPLDPAMAPIVGDVTERI